MNNIAFLIPSITMGGAEKLTLTIMNKLSELENVSVYLITLEKEINIDFENDKIKILKLSNISTYSKLLKFIAIPFYVNKLSKTIRKNKINIVYSIMERANFVNVFTSKINTLYSPILSIHNAPSVSFKKRSFIKQKFIKYLYSNMPRNIEIVAVSNGIKKELEILYQVKNITVIHNPINIDEITYQASLIIEKQIIDRSKFNIVAVGRLVEAKGFIYLIKAFAKIDHNIRQNMNLILIGDGVEIGSLRECVLELGIKNEVKFLGYQSNPYKYMKRCDLFVLSSLWEGFGIVVAEAMALEIPVLSSNCKYGPSEILLDSDKIEYGLLVDLSDNKEKYIDDLANSMMLLYHDYELREKYKMLSLKRVALFSIEHVIEDYINLFNNGEKNG